MSGWIVILLLSLAVAAALFPFARRDRGAIQFLLAALLLALAGYSWQGRPNQQGSPKAEQPPRTVADDDFATLHPDLLGRFDRAYSWMQLADADRRQGNPAGAAEILQSAVRANPRSYALWTAYAYALVASNGDLMSPAAMLAFERAAQLAPDHPAPKFFFALALSRGGNWDSAEQNWRELLQGLGTGYPLYRTAIEERLAAIRQARASGSPVAPAAPLPQQQPGQPGADGNTAAPVELGNSTAN